MAGPVEQPAEPGPAVKGVKVISGRTYHGILARVVLPAAVMALVMAGSKYLYNLSWMIPDLSLHRAAAFVLGLTLNLSITFGASWVYPVAYFRGARLVERVAACLVTPLLWNLWEILRVTEFFSPAESLYYGLNSLFLGTLAFTVFQMGLWEIICRYWSDRLKARSVWSGGPVLAMILGAAAVFVFNIWGLGAHWFYLYGNLYKALFH